jgi:predicted negative regulator of RcsB-dependent stress response
MKTFLVVIVLLLVVVAGLGFYRGWFHFSTASVGQKSSATITVDRDKIQKDESKIKADIQDIEHKVAK